jgi:hypothetical protein
MPPNSLSVPFGKNRPLSPLVEIEDDLCELLILFGDTGAALTPPEAIRFTNSVIKGTPIQKKLVQWKRNIKCKGSDEKVGYVGMTYFFSFMKRNKDKLRSKRGK